MSPFHSYYIFNGVDPNFQIDALSELFVEWDGILSVAEDRVWALEREKAEKIRLGLEAS